MDRPTLLQSVAESWSKPVHGKPLEHLVDRGDNWHTVEIEQRKQELMLRREEKDQLLEENARRDVLRRAELLSY
jgi:hypothetical protein